MSTEVHNPNEQSAASLVGGIVKDVQDLVKQQLRLTRQEVQNDLRQSKKGFTLLTDGLTLILVGEVAVCLMLAHLLHWLGMPTGADPSVLPLWVSFAIVACIFFIAGGVVVMSGRKKLEALADPLPDTTRALQENLEWKTKTNPS
jgi:hypothetical protein